MDKDIGRDRDRDRDRARSSSRGRGRGRGRGMWQGKISIFKVKYYQHYYDYVSPSLIPVPLISR